MAPSLMPSRSRRLDAGWHGYTWTFGAGEGTVDADRPEPYLQHAGHVQRDS